MLRTTPLAWVGLVLAWATAGRAAEPGGPSVVELRLQVRGELFATASAGAEPVRRPITLDGQFEFVEQALPASGSDTVARRYTTARAAIEIEGRRAGDPAGLVANVERIRTTLPWQPQFQDIDTIVAHALAWEKRLQGKRGSAPA